MATKNEELKKDLAELQALEAQATRPKVRDLLSLEIRKVSSEIVKLQEALDAPAKDAAATAASTANKRYQIKLTNYGWDQTSRFVKFYVNLEKVHTIPQENITCNFTSKSLELIVTNLENKDYVFTINNLLNKINTEGSTWKIKTGMVIINCEKTKSDNWSHVTELEKKVNDAQNSKIKPDDNMDPSDGLMSIMKNMYDKGDDELKRTIAKAWSESQNKPPSFL